MFDENHSEPAPAACEIHIWPAAMLETSSEGWVLNNTHNKDLRDKSGKVLPVAAMLSPERQLALLSEMDLSALFNIADALNIRHDEPLPPAMPGEVPLRHAVSVSPCYAELIVRHVTIARAPMASTSLHVIAQFRAFSTSEAPVRSYTGFASAAITLPDGRERVNENDAVYLDDAFRADIQTFARAMLRPKKGTGIHQVKQGEGL